MKTGIGIPIPTIVNLPGQAGGSPPPPFQYTAIDNSFSMEFDGTAYYTAGNPVALQMTGDFTITGWLKCTGSTYKRVVRRGSWLGNYYQ